ncbi:hypothetical protein [Edaphobacter sp.]|uniref:hypothetical protein n=1 Tax=Edaphobacter sp. TaxID=1934404 RepID=UPI002DBE4F94|nr:hypothetical protein [Edaphobacter sp.]HEU5342143.1 hypothetical protein [Edaphobacter sp.]
MRALRLLVMVPLLAGLATTGSRAWADAALLMEEPFGNFGSFNPTGHAAVYLDRVCAETPVRLRLCAPNEDGVVISRYHKVGGYDWIAIPLVPYLYAVDHVEDIPATADLALETSLRDQYRREHLLDIVPNTTTAEAHGEPPPGDWIQLVGASYDRKIYGFQIETTREQDERFIALFNDRRNVAGFNLVYRNCADFSRNLINVYYPHAVRRNFLVDLGITTPKQVARSLTKYAHRHPGLDFSTFIIPQVPGTIPRSHPIRGVVESVVKSKKYVVPLAILNPQLTAGLAIAYFTDGRFRIPKGTEKVLLPDQDDDKQPTASPAAE